MNNHTVITFGNESDAQKFYNEKIRQFGERKVKLYSSPEFFNGIRWIEQTRWHVSIF